MKRVYFIQSEDGPIKIGISHDPYSRLTNLQNGNPAKLKLICQSWNLSDTQARDIEIAIHDKFTGQRLHGEWFDLGPDDVYRIMSKFHLYVPKKTSPSDGPKTRREEQPACCGSFRDWWRAYPGFVLENRT